MEDNEHLHLRLMNQKIRKLDAKNVKSRSKAPVSDKEDPLTHGNLYFLKSMLNTLLNPISYRDRNGLYLGVNEYFARQIFGLPEEDIIGYTLPEVCERILRRFPQRSAVNGNGIGFAEICREWERVDTELLRAGGRKTHEQEVILADGSKAIFLVNRSTFNDKNGDILGLATVMQDITELRKSQKSLEEHVERYRIVTEQTGQLVYDYDSKSEKGNWRGTVEEITGYLPQEFKGISLEVWSEHIHPEDREHIIKQITKIQKKGGKYRLEFRFRKKDGTYFYAEDNGVCLLAENGKPYRFLGVIKDISERKLAQKKLEISEEKYRSFISNFKGIAFQLDENLVPEFVHGAVEEITGYSEEDFMSMRVWWMDIVHPEDAATFNRQVMRIKKSPYAHDTRFEYRIKRKDGETKWIHELYQKIPAKGGKPAKYQGAVYDITDKKEAEKALNEIKEARIKEIHHRIKNNLQVISSLLDLQAEKFGDERVREAFRESQSRVISMALIHEELYHERNMDTLNFAAYLRKLSENLFQTYRLDHPGINLQIDLNGDVFLSVDSAIPLGIIMNELISNSLKHAFPEQKRGEIKVKLYIEEDSEKRLEKDGNKECKRSKLVLTVSDNGIGIPENIDMESPDTLGLQLVSALVDQLDGELKLKRDNGTIFTIRINIPENFGSTL